MSNLYAKAPAIEVPGFPGTNLAILSPQEVIALNEYAAISEANQCGALELALNGLLKTLPEHHSEFGRAVFTEFSTCPDDFYRGQIGSWISSLTRANHDAGFALWDRLLRDSEDDVRYRAYEKLSNPLQELAAEGGGYTSINERFKELGLSWRDALRLEESYIGAKHGENLLHTPYPEGIGKAAYATILVNRGRGAFQKLTKR